MTKREDLLFSFLGGGDGICRLNVHLPRTTIDDKVDFILSKHMFPRSEIMALHNSNINGIPTAVHTLLEPGFVAEGWFWYNSQNEKEFKEQEEKAIVWYGVGDD